MGAASMLGWEQVEILYAGSCAQCDQAAHK